MPVRFVKQFIKLESSAGLILFLAAALALIVDNSGLAPLYNKIFGMVLQISLGGAALSKPLLQWVNDGLMTLFFLLVGLEVKREILAGELNTLRRAMLPAVAALGGMIVPALIYVLVAWHEPVAIKGWAIPVATDTAFALAVLALLGRRLPVSLKIFLTALAIFDDIGAIVVMAIFYSSHIAIVHLCVALGLVALLMLFNYKRVTNLFPYLFAGFFLWLCVLNSGVHATLAGIVLAMTIPLDNSKKDSRYSPLRWLEKKLHPVVAFYVLPIFAFANAGVSFQGLDWSDWLSPVPMGIALGLFVGKQIGIWGASIFAVRCRLCALPGDLNLLGLYGLSVVAGVGFTMSLFIGSLAFHSAVPFSAYVRMGVIAGSLISGLGGYWILRLAYPKNGE